MNINPDMTKHYGNFHLLERRKNKAKTNPIKPNFTNYFERGILFTRSETQSLEPKCKPAQNSVKKWGSDCYRQ
jgi:hypothetical protein